LDELPCNDSLLYDLILNFVIKVENIIMINWLTDITGFHIPDGKIYLSPIIDCFDGIPVSCTIGTSPIAELVNTIGQLLH
jgi:transposase InsO family protein